ncbi:PREDICTED: uncharacterized protein LOC104820136 [Tarenaya hassleriana]|uniref:uncharacterized protein LOC104820136 n=1 Tax=Tarenaya hassleriana TaxID=28532 RepID=UPI00053C6638|nr:PREDICTED: uncharacterized protein LOC104820136 [Tarenaya hassleriana]
MCRKEGWIYDGYRCSECRDFTAHKECAESPPEIDSPSHPQHPLKLLVSKEYSFQSHDCDCCGVQLLSGMVYHCSVCDFWLDIYCARLPPPHDMENPKAHYDHPLTYMKKDMTFTCHVCDSYSYGNRYECKRCGLDFHRECADLCPQITHSAHRAHPLKLLKDDGVLDHTSVKCCLCQDVFHSRRCYICSLCKFIVHVECAKSPPPLSFSSLTTHDHVLTLLPIRISFTCNACGMDGDWSPYVCLQCCFVIHIRCVDLPRLININHHDHRVSRTYSLPAENHDSVCGVCRKTIDRRYDAYSCSRCSQYAVHSRCATLENVWDGKELYGKPEEVEDIEPFKVIAHNVIEHFSHKKHHLRLTKGGIDCESSMCCKACIRPIYSDPFYNCMQRDFILHGKCANLPIKKRHEVFSEEFTLLPNAGSHHGIWFCHVCDRFSDGFKYISDTENIVAAFRMDVPCSSIREPFDDECHPHPLYYISDRMGKCMACGEMKIFVLRCVEEDCGSYALCYRCAGLPRRVKHKVDDHTLVLRYGEKEEKGKYWCDVCEKKTNPSKWFYTCDDCGLTLHVKCVLGDFANVEPGITFRYYHDADSKYEVVANDSVNRPLCCKCKRRCMSSNIIKTCEGTDRYLCSIECT